MRRRFLTALPVYNEVQHVTPVLDEVRRYSPEVLVVDDGSSDGTEDVLAGRKDVFVIRHETNRGYGAALASAFDYAQEHDYDVLVTIDCDGQHEPQRIPQFVEACTDAVDIVSGSRYLHEFEGDIPAPADRRRINHVITEELNRWLPFQLTDAFCGFKAYRVSSLACFDLVETGYAMPLELWVQAAYCQLRVAELPVPLIYLDEKRSFGGSLDDAQTRLAHYREVIERSQKRAKMGKRPFGRVGSPCA
jgi:dolichol-phosphate mannosyltransferase